MIATTGRWLAAGLALTNLAAVVVFFALRWDPHAVSTRHYQIEKILVLIYLSGLLAILAVAFWRKAPGARFVGLNVGHCVFVLTIAAADVALSAWPRLLPASVVAALPQLDPRLRQARNELLEYLPDSPWVKFRPEVTAASLGARGADFAYSWRTDRLGFKNEPGLAARRDVLAVAIGDSFVEGMGCPSRIPGRRS